MRPLLEKFYQVTLAASFVIALSDAGKAQSADSTGPKLDSPNFMFYYCEKEATLYCKDKKTNPEIGACLISHDTDLSVSCKQEIQRFLDFRRQAATRGGGALSSFGGLNAMGPAVPLVSYEGRYSPGAIPFEENKANVSIPVYKSERDSMALSVAGGDFHLGTPLTLDSGKQVPLDLYRVEVGAQYSHRTENMKMWGFRGSVGYAGDAPFQKASDATYSLMANYGFPGSGINDHWLLSVFLSNNSPIGNFVPFPGVDYLFRTETLTGHAEAVRVRKRAWNESFVNP